MTMSSTTTVRCAYVNAGSKHMLCAQLLTTFGDEGLSDDALFQLGEKRLAEHLAELQAVNEVVSRDVKIGVVAVDNPAYEWPTNDDF